MTKTAIFLRSSSCTLLHILWAFFDFTPLKIAFYDDLLCKQMHVLGHQNGIILSRSGNNLERPNTWRRIPSETPRKGVYLSGGKITTQNSKHKRSGDAYTWAGSSFNVVSSVPGQQLLGQQIPDLGFTFFLRGTGQTTCTKLLTHIFDASFEGKMVICVTKIYAIYIINFWVAGHFDEKSETRWVGAI